MTDGLDVALVNAALNLLNGVTALTVYDGAVPNPTPAPPYVVVYSIVSWPADDDAVGSLDGKTRRATVRWICHCIGGSQQACREVAQLVRTALLDQRPTVAGVTCGFIRDEQDDPPDRNEQTGSVVFDAVHVYRMTADK